MTVSARQFAGGVSTDNILSTSAIIATTVRAIHLWAYINTIDVTTRRLCEWDGFNDNITIAFNVFNFISVNVGWTTTGTWNVAPPATGGWHSIVVNYDGSSSSNAPDVYYDAGSREASVGGDVLPTGSINNASGKLCLGNRNVSFNRVFDGGIMGYARYSSLLSSQDRTDLANGIAPCAVNQANLVVYWPLDAGDSPEPELVSSNSGVVTGTTVVTGPSAVTNPRCQQIPRRLQRVLNPMVWRA